MELDVLDPLEVDQGLLTLGEGRMLPKLKLSSDIHSSVGPLRMLKLMKQVIIETYNMMTWHRKTTAVRDTFCPHMFHLLPLFQE